MNDTAACPICYSNYNDSENLPRIIPICGHTICHTCIYFILRGLAPAQPFQCPLDKKNFTIQRNDVSFFPVNHALRDTLNEKNCPEHNKPLDIICTREKTLICYLCALTGSHKGHEVKPLKDLMQGIQKKRKVMENAFANVAKFQEEAEYIKNDRKGRVLEFIEEKFKEFQSLLMVKKLEVLEAAKIRLNNDFGKQGVSDHDEDVDKVKVRIKEILKILEGDTGNGVINDVDDELIQSTLKMMDELKFDQRLRSLERLVTKFHINFDGKFEQAIQDCCYFDDEIPKRSNSRVLLQEEIIIQRPEQQRIVNNHPNQVEEEKLNKSERAIPAERFQDFLNNNDFVYDSIRNESVAASTQANSSNSMGREQEQQQHQAERSDSGPLYVLEDSRNGVLCVFSKRAHRIPPNARSVQNLVTLLDLDSLKNFKCVELEFPRTIWSTHTVDTFSYLIPNLQSLLCLRADFSDSRIERIDFTDFTYPLLKVADTLEEFYLNLDGTTLEDEEVSYLLINAVGEMKNLKSLDLNFLHLPLTDKSIRSLIRIALPKLTQLQSLALNFGYSKITDEGIEHFNELDDMNHLSLVVINLCICNTVVSNQGIKVFTRFLRRLRNIRELTINVEGTQVNTEIKRMLEFSGPKEQLNVNFII